MADIPRLEQWPRDAEGRPFDAASWNRHVNFQNGALAAPQTWAVPDGTPGLSWDPAGPSLTVATPGAFTGGLAASGGVDVAGPLGVTGPVTLTGAVTIAGEVAVTGGLQATGGLAIAGDVRLADAPTDKVGLFGAPPVVRQAVAAAATDLPTALALVNDLRAKLRLYGWFA